MAGLLESAALDAASQMALDEAQLERGAQEGGVLRFYRWTGPAVTFGYFQPHEQARALARERGLGGAPAVRRPTGGGVVFHDGDLTFSWVFAWPEATAPQAIYKNLHRSAHLGLKALGLKTRLWSPPQGKSAPAPACFPCPAPIDLVDEDGRKLLGGALRKRRGFGLYQGSLRTQGLGRGAAELENALADGIFEGRTPRRSPAEDGVSRRAEELAREKYATKQWNERR